MKAAILCVFASILILAVVERGNGNPVNPISPFGNNAISSSTSATVYQSTSSSTGIKHQFSSSSSTGTIHDSSTGTNSVGSSSGTSTHYSVLTPDEYRLAKQAGLFAAYPPLNPSHI